LQDGQAHAVLLVEHEGFTDVLYVDHVGLVAFSCRVAASPYPAYKVRCSFCRVAAAPYPAYKVRYS
jgi:hypothetical protein